jgi:hypothetical protein
MKSPILLAHPHIVAPQIAAKRCYRGILSPRALSERGALARLPAGFTTGQREV